MESYAGKLICIRMIWCARFGEIIFGSHMCFFLVTGRDGKGGGRGRALEFSVMFFI